MLQVVVAMENSKNSEVLDGIFHLNTTDNGK